MKKRISILLISIFMLGIIMCGCNQNSESENRQGYIVNNGGIINVGVIAPITGDNAAVGNDIVLGVEFANSLAEVVNIDSSYLINLCIYDINDDIYDTARKLINEKVAAVICAGTDRDKTNTVIDAFKEYSTPIVFTDGYSDKIESCSTSFSLSVPYNYQNSLLSAYLSAEGFASGAVICADDDYSTTFAESFKSMFENYGGNVTVKNQIQYDSEDFVFVIGNDSYKKNVAEVIKAEAPDAKIILSEVYNKMSFDSDSFEDVCFVSKFEIDVENNHIGTDFLNVYSNMYDVNESDVSSAVAYGYDAYMIIYGALAKSNPNSAGMEDNASDNGFKLNVSTVNESIDTSVHYGVTDTFDFNDKGLVETSFVYLDIVENSKAAMLNRYVF